MNQNADGSDVSLSVPQLLQIDAICRRFEAAWQTGQQPKLEEFLADTPEPQRSQLRKELAAIQAELQQVSPSGARSPTRTGITRPPSLPSAEWVEAICAQYEKAWQSVATGEPGPRIEDYLPDPADPGRPLLLCRLLMLDIRHDERRGRIPTEQEFLARFPQDGQVIRDTFHRWRRAHSSADVAQTETSEVKHDGTGSDALTPGQNVGRYTIVAKLGQGGFAEVYLADDDTLPRRVAIKVPHRGHFQTREQVDQFLHDARAAVQVAAPGIVAIYDVGQFDDGMPYLVMEYVEGRSLREQLTLERPPPDRAAELVAGIAEIIHHAHKAGFVHRDLKPGNILLDLHGNPHVADFGLAVDEGSQRSMAGECSGTLPYMAPEQVRGETHRLDGRADIWALGVMLYEMLAGKRPFGGDSNSVVIDEILHRDPKPLRQIDDSIPAVLDQICLKCLAKVIADRYPTAADLAKDLRRWLRPRSPRVAGSVRVIAACAVLLALFVVGIAVFRRQGESPLPVGPAVAQELRGLVDVLVWDPQDSTRRGITLREPGALPLRANDQIRVRAVLSRAAYIYLLWIDARGQVSPVYPWRPGQWDERPPRESPQEAISLPEQLDEGWRIVGDPGMETLLLLARDAPLPPEVDLSRLLTGLKSQPMQDESALVEFEGGQVVTEAQEPDRGPQFFEAEQIDDPVLKTQQWLVEKLAPHFPLIRAQSFAHRRP